MNIFSKKSNAHYIKNCFAISCRRWQKDGVNFGLSLRQKNFDILVEKSKFQPKEKFKFKNMYGQNSNFEQI